MSISTPTDTSRSSIRAFVEHPIFQRFIIILIILNAIALGLDTSPSIMARFGGFLDAADDFVLAVFVLELMLRIIAYRGAFFRDPWSLFDLVIVGSALLPHSEVFAMLRILRVLRLLRLITLMPSLRLVIGGLLSALPGMGSVMLLLAVFMYMGAVMVTNLFGTAAPLQFGDIGKSIFSMLQVTTMDGWPDIARAAMKTAPYAWIFFFGFIFITSFTVLNLFVGVMVSAMESRIEEDKAEKQKVHQARVDAGQEQAPAEPVSRELAQVLDEIRQMRGVLSEMRTALDKSQENSSVVRGTTFPT